MSIFLGILLTLFVFLVVVIIHELGHFSMARLTGMRVLEFGFGIPPKVFRVFRDRKGTDYTFNALPIWGFVRIKWEDPTSLEALDPDSFSSKSWWARALVLVAGVTMNFLLAIVILCIFFVQGTAPIAPNFLTEKDYNSLLLPSPETALVSGYLIHNGIELSPLTGSIAERSGLVEGDMLISIDGQSVTTVDEFKSRIEKNIPLILTVSWATGESTLSITPESSRIGVALGYKDLAVNQEYGIKYTPIQALTAALHETYVLSYMTVDVLGKTVKNLIVPATPADREEAKAMVAWPIGISAGFVDLVDIGISWHMIWMIIAMVSVNLWVFNLLPFPALDGGRLVSTSVNSLLSYIVKDTMKLAHIETYIHSLGMILLLGLSLLIAFFDVSKLF